MKISIKDVVQGKQLNEFLAQHGEVVFGRKMTQTQFHDWMKGYDYLVLVIRSGKIFFRRFNSKREISEKEQQNRLRFTERVRRRN